MSACAGSSTERICMWFSCASGKNPARKSTIFEVFRRLGPDGSRPAGQGFMSTQRREYRSQRTSCTGRAGGLGTALAGPIARHACANVSGGTAPPGISVCHPNDEDLSLGTPARAATISLQLGNRIVQLVLQYLRHDSPPVGAGPGAGNGTSANHGSSLPHIPIPSGLARFHRTLSRVPAGRRRRAERYDGKGNLYLQHAA